MPAQEVVEEGHHAAEGSQKGPKAKACPWWHPRWLGQWFCALMGSGCYHGAHRTQVIRHSALESSAFSLPFSSLELFSDFISKIEFKGPGWVGQLVRVLSRNTKVVGLVPGHGTYKNQPMNSSISRITNQFSLSLFLFVSFFLSL